MNPIPQVPREELVDKYFNPIPAKPSYGGALAAAITGAALLVIGLTSVIGSSGANANGPASGLACLGCLGLLGGLACGITGCVKLLNKYSTYQSAMKLAFPRASDEQMDAWLGEGMWLATEVGKRRLNRSAAEVTFKWGTDMLVFTGLPPDNTFQIRMARGADRILRASYYKILVVFLSHYRLSTYECVLEMRSGLTIIDATKEYHLQSVDGLETVSDRVNGMLPNGMPGPGTRSQNMPTLLDGTGRFMHVTTTQILRLMVAGQPAISLVMGIAGADQRHVDNVSSKTHSNTDEMIFTLREYLRNHNGGVVNIPVSILPPGMFPQQGLGTGQQPPYMGEPPPMPPHMGQQP